MTSRSALAARASASIVWLMLGRWSQLAITLGTLAVMTRVLGPEIIGAYSLAYLAMALADSLIIGTFSDTLIQRASIEPRHMAAACLITMSIALLLALALIPAAAPIALAMQAPMMADVIPWIGLAILLLAAGVVPTALLQRDFRQRTLVLVEQAAWIVSSLVGIALALAGAGIWSLVAQEMTRVLVRTVGLQRQARWRPSFRTDRAAIGDVWQFGRSMVAMKLLFFANGQIPRLVIGFVLGPVAVGYFGLGWRLYDQINKMLVGPMTSVAMATAARAQDDLPLLRELLASASRTSSLVAYPAFVGAAAAAPVAIPLLFGNQWHGAILPAQILALMGMRSSISGFNSGLIRGLGRPDLQLRMSLATLAVTLVAVPLAAPYGVAAVALVLLARSVVTWPLGALYVQRLIGLPALFQTRLGTEAAVAALGMGAIILLLQQLLAHWPPLLLMPVLVVAGGVAYVALIAAIAPSTARGLLQAILAFAGGDRSAATSHLAEVCRVDLPENLKAAP